MPGYIHNLIYYSAPTIVRFAGKWAQFSLMEFHKCLNIVQILPNFLTFPCKKVQFRILLKEVFVTEIILFKKYI